MTPATLVWHLRDEPGLVWLDGGSDGWHVIAWAPDEVVTQAADWPTFARALAGRPTDGPAPFTTGVLGYVGYGAGHAVEAVPEQAPTPEPPVWLGAFRRSVAYRKGRWHVTGDRAFRQQVEHLLEQPAPPPSSARPTLPQTVARATYVERVERVLAYIAAGDCYQVNLSRPVFVDLDDPLSMYRRLRQHSNATMGAWMQLGDVRVLSNSPEVLLDVNGRHLRSIPIKGTRKRGMDVDEDARLLHDLLHAEKDHAELAMIVDLVRNDLGRVAATGSVVAGERTLTTHANVHHASWPVEATLADGKDGWDALAAVFPPGSVTGAPKVRATQRIQELEDHPRGLYCGTVGYLDDRGNGSWSVAIRTAVWSEGRLRYHVGGGIVADSDPVDEWEETCHKGRALAAAAGISPRPST